MTDTYELPEVTDAQIDVLWEQYVGIGMGLQGRLFARAILLQHSLQMRAYGQEYASLAVKAERERTNDLLAKCAAIAEWHIGDGDECGVLAREVFDAIRKG